MSGKVIFGEETIHILDGQGKEVVMWHKQEWIDDPEVVFSITNAVKIALTEGADKVARMIQN